MNYLITILGGNYTCIHNRFTLEINGRLSKENKTCIKNGIQKHLQATVKSKSFIEATKGNFIFIGSIAGEWLVAHVREN